MSKGKRELTADEKNLWRRVAAAVKPRRPSQTSDAPPHSASAPHPARTRATPEPPRQPSSAAALPDRAGEKRVRRGKVDVGATLDLHGHTQVSARATLVRFLRAAQARGDRVVVVVTGVGRAGEGVLRRRLPEWLAEGDLRSMISGYAQAHRAHGGAGAYYVFIKRPRAETQA